VSNACAQSQVFALPTVCCCASNNRRYAPQLSVANRKSRTALKRMVVSNRHPHALPARTLICLFNGQSRATTSVDAATTKAPSHASQLPRARDHDIPICGSLCFRSVLFTCSSCCNFFQCLNHCSRANLQHIAVSRMPFIAMSLFVVTSFVPIASLAKC